MNHGEESIKDIRKTKYYANIAFIMAGALFSFFMEIRKGKIKRYREGGKR